MSPSDRDAGHADRREVIAIPAPGKMPYLTLGGLLSIAPIAIAIASLGGFSSEIPVERLPAVLGLVLLIEVPIAVLLIWLSTRRRVDWCPTSQRRSGTTSIFFFQAEDGIRDVR